jgi:heparan-alpha-glucosaminide N-acetyltransferase
MSWIERTEQYWNGLDLWSLKTDQAFVNFTSVTPSDFFLYSLSEDCDKCPYKRIFSISETESSEYIFKIETARQLQLKIFNQNHGNYEYNNK